MSILLRHTSYISILTLVHTSMPYYAVARGKVPGIYESWPECKRQVLAYKGSRYKKFNTRKEAEQFVTIEGDKSTSTPDATEIKHKASKRAAESDTKEVKRSKSDEGYIVAYTDGACRQNGMSHMPLSGLGVYWPGTKEGFGVPLDQVDDLKQNKPTNQRAELLAIIYCLKQAVEKAPIALKIYTDSQYSIKAITSWSKKWKANGWKTSKNEPVVNRDLIEKCLELVEIVNKKNRELNLGRDVEFAYVAGHKGHYGNEMADKLANDGADKMVQS